MIKKLLGMLCAVFAALVLASPAHAGTDDYPDRWRNVPQDSAFDDWRYYNRECVSFVAWRLSARNGMELSDIRGLGNASAWKDRAIARGYAVNGIPAVGAVAWWRSGHVAWVESVSKDRKTVHVEEYNFDFAGHYYQRDVSVSRIDAFIHFKDIVLPTTRPAAFRNDLAWFDGRTLWGLNGPTLPGATRAIGYALPQWAAAGDYTHDGREDLFWYHKHTGTIYVMPGSHFASARAIRGPGIARPVWASSGDFDGNGYRDELVWYDGAKLYLFSGAGLVTRFETGGYSAPTWAGVGDYNQDGKDDIYWYHGGDDGSIYVLNSTGSGFRSATRVAGPGLGKPQWAAVGDLDGNGKRNDLAWYSHGVLFAFVGPGLPAKWHAHGYAQPQWAGVADHNQDGKDDIYWYHSSHGVIYSIASSGSGFNSAHKVAGPGIGAPLWAATGDFIPQN